MASRVVSSPVQEKLRADSNDKTKKKSLEQEWIVCVITFCGQSVMFGLSWFFLKGKELEKQQKNEDFGTLSRIGYGMGYAAYLSCIIGALIMKSPNNVIRKIASGADRAEDIEKDYAVHSTWFSAFLCCFSLFWAGSSFWLLNDVTEIVVKYNTKADLDRLVGVYFYTAPYSLGFTTFLSMAIVCVFRTYNLILINSRQMLPVSNSD
ncbi:hypothetical protein CCACVL1_13142 [Corchorus capsularis]|uniref:Uncharacterized protein n=1 Tax=Corchorus capsularis TaxID=210143 RepID=A0A1R3IC33_COCAP|nr:hypothetical protein CCACVL1_13142 [Corchorus capsularis]